MGTRYVFSGNETFLNIRKIEIERSIDNAEMRKYPKILVETTISVENDGIRRSYMDRPVVI